MSQPVNIQDDYNVYQYVDFHPEDSRLQQMHTSNCQKIIEATQAFLERKNQIHDQNLPCWRLPASLVSAGTCGSISAVSGYVLGNRLATGIVSLITDPEMRSGCGNCLPFCCSRLGCCIGGIAGAAFVGNIIEAKIEKKAMDKADIATYEDFQKLYQMKKEAYKSELAELSRLIKDLKELISKTPPGEAHELLRTHKSQLKSARRNLISIKSAELDADKSQLEALEKRIIEEHPERKLMRNSANLPETFKMV